MTEPTTGGVDDESLAETFRAVAARLRRQTREALEPWAVTPSQSRALGVLARLGEARPGTLAEHLRIAPRSATEVIDDLQDRGSSRADPTRPTDGPPWSRSPRRATGSAPRSARPAGPLQTASSGTSTTPTGPN